MKKISYRPLVIFILVALIRSTNAAPDPCTPMDHASSPSARPRLLISVEEATKQALNSPGEKYQSEIRLHGVYGAKTPSGIQLTFGSSYRTVNPKEYFTFVHEQVTPFRNLVRLVKHIDRDGPTDSVMDDTIVDHFRLRCVPSQNTSLEYWYDVSLLVHDVNDNAPQLNDDNVYSATVNELIPVGSSLPIKVSATDKDSGSNRQLTYRMAAPVGDSMGAKHLMIHNETGLVSLRRLFDYDTLNAGNRIFQVPVIVHDNGKLQQLTTTTTFTITVADGDDLGPQFYHPACQKAFGGKCFTPTYNAAVESVSVNSPILFASSGGGPLMEIKAKDGDTLNAKIEFKLSAVIPSRFKYHFKLKVSAPETGDNGYSTASLKLIKPIHKTDLAGTVVYITATEDTPRRIYSVARILFKGKTTGSSGETQKQEGKPTKVENGYNSETLGLIVAVSILAVITLIVLGVLISIYRRSKNEKTGNINEGLSL